ncbi:MAG: tetratricopeptide repeat protein, partial [Saprospiraceae bacterium]|nr:tetratricopeptide repeat protein [Saprospiraceae bacterium]
MTRTRSFLPRISVIVSVLILGMGSGSLAGQGPNLPSLDATFEAYWNACAYDQIIQESSAALSRQNVDRVTAGHIAYWQGMAWYERGETELAESSIAESVVLLENRPEWVDSWARSVLQQAQMRFDQQGVGAALPLVQSVLDRRNVGDRRVLSALAMAMYLYGEFNQMPKADSIWAIGLDHIALTGDSLSGPAARFYQVGALNFTRRHRLGAALKYGEKAVEIMRNRGEVSVMLMNVLGNLATVLGDHRRYDEAIQLFEEALNLPVCDGVSRTKVAAIISGNLGAQYKMRRQYRYAQVFLLEALRLHNSIIDGPHNWKLNSLFHLIDLYGRQGMRDSVIQRVEDFREMWDQVDHPNPVFLSESHTTLARVEPDPQMRLAHILRSYQINDSVFGPRHFTTISSGMGVASAYAGIGDYDNALKFQRLVNETMAAIGGHPPIPELYLELTEGAINTENLSAAEAFHDTAIVRLGQQTQADVHILDAMVSAPELFYQSGLLHQEQGWATGDTQRL